MKEKLLDIVNHYGLDKQLKYIHTEYFELDEAIMTGGKEEIAEELADVMVMLKQFQYYYNISDDNITSIMNYKIDRQLVRISDEE